MQIKLGAGITSDRLELDSLFHAFHMLTCISFHTPGIGQTVADEHKRVVSVLIESRLAASGHHVLDGIEQATPAERWSGGRIQHARIFCHTSITCTLTRREAFAHVSTLTPGVQAGAPTFPAPGRGGHAALARLRLCAPRLDAGIAAAVRRVGTREWPSATGEAACAAATARSERTATRILQKASGRGFSGVRSRDLLL
jgi:hypothetical protein